MSKKDNILLLMEISDNEEISEMFREKVPFLFEDEDTAFKAFDYMVQNASKYIHSAQFLQL
jgi:hypothetical protein